MKSKITLTNISNNPILIAPITQANIVRSDRCIIRRRDIVLWAHMLVPKAFWWKASYQVIEMGDAVCSTESLSADVRCHFWVADARTAKGNL
jgi:hypothetical protein